MIRNILIILLLSLGFVVYGQKTPYYKEKRKSETFPGTLRAQVMDNTIIVKLKQEHRDFFNTPGYTKSIQQALAGVSIKTVEKMFPNSTPTAALNKSSAVDLTLVYKINYTGSISVEALAEKLEETGYFEYAEAQVVESLLYMPNDTLSVPDDDNYAGKATQNHLIRIKAFEAWDIEQGDTNVVIGVIDTGTDFNNPEFTENIKYNYADPINGIDDDGDGYIDNFHGYDLADKDNNPQHTPNKDHGLSVAGCSSAATDNITGIAGTGFKCKYLPVKGSRTADSIYDPPIVAGYEGIVYAARQGCKVIVCSWGSPNSYSKLNQDIINYVVETYDVVIVAAAGNTHGEYDFYPASYDNVISVAATIDTNDTKWNNSSYSHKVDLSAQGKRILAIGQNNTYKYVAGTSFSAPLVAGAAGLVRSKYPHLNALQVAELLRVTADNIDTVPGNEPYKEKLGKGRLNMYKALTDTISPAIRMTKSDLRSDVGIHIFPGDTVKAYFDFLNYLHPTQNLEVVLSCSSPLITMIDSTANLGTINTLETKVNTDDPFVFYVNPTGSKDITLKFRLGYSDPDKNYTDYQYFYYKINPSYINIDTNKVKLSITSNGRLGFGGPEYSIGEGLVYKNKMLLYEAGLMLATKIGNDSLVSDCVRNYYWGIDNDLKSVRDIRFVRNSIKDQEVHNYLNDSAAANPIGVSILQKSYAWKEAPNDKFVIVEYQITNDRTDTLHQLNVGLFADWDIVTANNQYYNRAKFDTTINLGYVYNNDPNSLYAGIALLTEDAPICYSMDHANFVNNINPVDNVNGFSHKEKYQALTGGLAKLEAGFLANVDISQIVGSELKNILPGETRTVAFAILAGDDFYDLKTSTIAAQNKFKSIKQGPTPLVNTIIYCPGDTLDIELAPTNGNNFKFYGDQSLTDLLHTGSSYNLSNFTQTDTIYITNADSLFESNAVVQLIQHSDTPSADFIIAEDTLVLGINSTAYFFNTSQGATSYEWDFGDASTSTLTHPSYKYTEAGNYTVRLIATDIYGCKDTTYKELVVEIVSDLTEAIAEHILTQPNPVTDIMHLSLPSMDEPLTLVIYNYMGQEIITPIQIPERETHFSIDLSSLPQGMYTLKLIGNSGLVSKKIIKH